MGGMSARSTVAHATSLIDELTLLASRRGWREELAAATARLSDGGMPAAVVSIDVDEGIEGPDASATPAAVETVRLVARALAWVMGGDDFAARLEGGRFVVLVLGAAADDPRELRRRVQEALSSVGVTASIGISTARPGEDLTAVSDRAQEAAHGEPRRSAETVGPRSPLAEAAQELLLLVGAGSTILTPRRS